MKKIVFCLMAACLSLTFFPVVTIAQTKEATESTTLVIPKTTESVESKNSQKELNEATTENQSKIKSSKKHEQNKSNSENPRQGGVYISVGGILLLILLLIIIL